MGVAAGILVAREPCNVVAPMRTSGTSIVCKETKVTSHHPNAVHPTTTADPSVQTLVRALHLCRETTNRGQKTVILDDVSFEIPAGTLFAVSGPSGSGKSTLLNMLTGVDRPTSGQVLFGGEELRARSENALARWRGRNVGIIFQFFQLIPTLTAAENVLLALELGGGGGLPRREWQKRAGTCLEMVEAAAFARRLPSELSGGQQQRVAIARALANDPPVIVADEPTGNLDSHSAHGVFDTLAGLQRHGKTIVYVTHAPELAARADVGIELLDGRIVGRLGSVPYIAPQEGAHQ
jgi:ABC-type lipoprotein export system ATPase subunit